MLPGFLTVEVNNKVLMVQLGDGIVNLLSSCRIRDPLTCFSSTQEYDETFLLGYSNKRVNLVRDLYRIVEFDVIPTKIVEQIFELELLDVPEECLFGEGHGGLFDLKSE